MTSSNLPNATTLIAIGVIATATLDLWSLMLSRTLGLPMTNWGHVGRWVAGIPSGTYRHQSIGNSPVVRYEQAVGWATHYLIGVAYALAYHVILNASSQMPSAYSAAVFGIATVLAPWLILQPGLGVGFFASRSPAPYLTRTLNLLAHLVFGLGLYLGWRLLSLLGS